MTLTYYSLCALSLIIAFFAEKMRSKVFMICSLLIIGIISGCRAESVGIDTTTYYTYIEWSGKGILENVEVGFIYFTNFLLRIKHSPEFVVFVYSFLTNVFIIIRLWTLKEKASFTMMLFLYLALYFQLSMNIMRQFFAISIVFIATYFLQNRKKLLYFICVAIASFFHITAVLGVLIYFIYYPFKELKTVKGLLLSLAIVVVFLIIVQNYYGDRLAEKSEMYFKNMKGDVGLMIFAKLGLLVLFANSNKEIFAVNGEGEISDKICIIIYLIGLCITFVGYFYTYVDRIGLYFMIYEPVCLAIMCKRRNSSIFKFFVFLLAFFIIYMNYTANGQGVFPYNWIL